MPGIRRPPHEQPRKPLAAQSVGQDRDRPVRGDGMTDYIWAVRNPEGGMLGSEVAMARTAAADCVLGHAFPSRVDVQVRDDEGRLVAAGEGLTGGEQTPMCRLQLRDGRVLRENVWPDESDHGRPVLLVGGEAGLLQQWWN